MSRLHLIGLNHKTAPLEVRERFALPATRLSHALDYVRGVPGIAQTTILSTCNRVEIYAHGDEQSGSRLLESLAGKHSFMGAHGLEHHLYHLQDEAAVRHLFHVASGLDSLVLGEAEILGQVKAALERGHKHGTSGAYLDELFRRAIATGKRARTETAIGRGALSVGAAAVELAKQIFGNLSGHTVLILGAGKMSARVAQCLVSSGAQSVFVANRTFERAQELAQTFALEGANAQAVAWDDFPAKLKEVDIVIASTSAPGYVVSPEHLQSARKGRRRSLLLIDIAVPRDIDPACHKFDDVFCFDIDDLQSVVEDNRVGRSGEIAQVEAVIAEEIAAWKRWTQSQSAQPTMAALARRASAIREEEVAKSLARLEHLSTKDRDAVEALARALAAKLMHAPLAHLRNGGEEDAGALARAFGLELDAGGEE